jgi:putative transposase
LKPNIESSPYSCMRRSRILVDGARYHVTSRANRKEMILIPKHIKEMFLSVVKKAKNIYDFRIENFCLMGNHFHFIIQPKKGTSLSDIMRWMLSVFARRYNKKLKLTGHVWGERFFSKVISSLREYSQVFLYIDENPVKTNLVNKPWEWEYGGIGHFYRGRYDILSGPPAWMFFRSIGKRILGN